MSDIKNEFFNTLDTEKKENYKILFENANDEKNCKTDEIKDFHEKLKEFIELQLDDDEIDLSFVCFCEHYDFTDEKSSFFTILNDLKILKHENNEDGKIHSYINKELNFAEAKFYKRVEFIRVTFEKKMTFEGTWFFSDVNFDQAEFKNEVIFEGIRCQKEAMFTSTVFEKKASFYRARFNEYTSFKDANFYDEVDFENAISKDIFFFHNVKLGKINFIGSHFENANFLRLKNKDTKILKKDNFLNKDSVRYVKAQYDKENNTTEVNWSFPLEQEFYLDLLSKDSSYYPGKNINKISLLIHKYVSNYGTDWVRVLIILFMFGFIASLLYSFLPYCPEYAKEINLCKSQYFISFNVNQQWILWLEFSYACMIYIVYNDKENLFFWVLITSYLVLFFVIKEIQEVNNNVIALINPLNIFNQDIVILEDGKLHKNINYYENIALYGLIVKGIAITLIYQFIISFRNSTRRK